MQINEAVEREILILGPVGHLDTRTQGEFETKVLEKLGEGQRRFVIDMADVEYLASAGLRVMLMLAKKLKNTEGQMVICSMNEHVLEVFNVAGFSNFFTITDSKDEALGLFSSNDVEVDAATLKVSSLAKRLLDVSRGDGEQVAPPTPDAIAVAKRVAAIFGVQEVEKPKPPPPKKEKPKPAEPEAKPEPAKPAPVVAAATSEKKEEPAVEKKEDASATEGMPGCLGALMFWKK